MIALQGQRARGLKTAAAVRSQRIIEIQPSCWANAERMQ